MRSSRGAIARYEAASRPPQQNGTYHARITYVPSLREHKRRLNARWKLKLGGDPLPAANVGRNHPDYGMTPTEHWAAKETRVANG